MLEGKNKIYLRLDDMHMIYLRLKGMNMIYLAGGHAYDRLKVSKTEVWI